MIEMVIDARRKDLGGFEVGRVLPFHARRMVGPFVFLDQMGPAEFAPGADSINVRPHPHIGLSTLTYLFEGEIMHRDNLGFTQAIRPGEVNWMTAGKGVVHSERTDPLKKAQGGPMHGMQAWIALPKAHEETAPTFFHHAAAEMPRAEDGGVRIVLIAGHGWGMTSPVATFSDTVYAEATLDPGAVLPIGAEHEERAIYVVDGSVEIGGVRHEPNRLLVLRPGDSIDVRAGEQGARLMVLGGETMDGPRHLWWNFVSSSKERIEQAKADWQAGRFGKVPGDDEFIPLPE